jgi:hypothetical protein
VVPKSPAEQAGIRTPIRSTTQLRNRIGRTPVGERIDLAV